MTNHSPLGQQTPLSERLKRLTPARIALGRTGASLSTEEVLRLQLAHAAAHDAVHVPLDGNSLMEAITGLGLWAVKVQTQAIERDVYLRRPDLGRMLSTESARQLDGMQHGFDLAIVVGDGLSSLAVSINARPLLKQLIPKLEGNGFTIGPIVIARGARVALGDEIGERLGARLVLVLIGERPGLSSPDSLGVYTTYAPRAGRTDAERNCVSNIRSGGLDFEAAAAHKAAWLISAAFAAGLSGISLKDESGKGQLLT
jgi:ethanolamine ammonia-lyase small subunit